MPETKPDIPFDEPGVCSACRHFSLRASVDWDAPRAELVELLDRYRSEDGSNYDCLNPVSGGKDKPLPGRPDARTRDSGGKINRLALTQVGDISWPEHVAIFTIPVRVAVQNRVPLLIWGENSQNE
jgi:hypothetical protein